jgi:hypothetical protein
MRSTVCETVKDRLDCSEVARKESKDPCTLYRYRRRYKIKIKTACSFDSRGRAQL